MKRRMPLPLILLVSGITYSQIEFEKGYFIDDNNTYTECYIKNTDWKNNPTEFEYRYTAHERSSKGDVSTIREFGITGAFKYIGVWVNIDRSGEEYEKLSYLRNPEWNLEKLFLKVLVEGKASLYYFADGNLVRFFYSVSDSQVEQLEYKKYRISNNMIKTNTGFRQQLKNYVRCDDTPPELIETIDYSRSELVQYFINYNECESEEFKVYDIQKGKDLFHIKITTGMEMSSFSTSFNSGNVRDEIFFLQPGFRAGADAELLLPFNRNKWGIVVEPTFQHVTFNGERDSHDLVFTYNSIELPLGMRHYFFLKEKARIYMNGFFVMDFPVNSEFQYASNGDYILKSKHNFALGCGFTYKRWSAELRYYSNRELMSDYIYWRSYFNKFTLLLGYRIF